MRASERTRLGRGLAVVVAIGAALTACQALVTFAIEAPLGDAGATVDTGADAPDSGFDPCGPLPERPTEPTVEGDARILFAAYRWGFDTPDASDMCAQPGTDIDRVDSQRTAGSRACDTTATCKQYPGEADFSNCDGVGGIDNMALEFARTPLLNLTGRSPFSDEEVNASLTRGALNILLLITKYNGLDDDDVVEVTFYASAGMEGGKARGLGFEELKALDEVWDGGQDAAWIVDERSVESLPGLDRPRYTGPAYVARGMLVVDDVALGFGLPFLYAEGAEAFSHGRFSAKIVKDEQGRYKLTHGRLTGAISSRTLLGTLGTYRTGSSTGGRLLCDPALDDVYRAYKDIACRLLDLREDVSTPDRDALCAYASFGFSMAMVESRLATIDAGEENIVIKAPGTAQAHPPCPDYAARTVWCDDCAWLDAGRCDASLPGSDAADQ